MVPTWVNRSAAIFFRMVTTFCAIVFTAGLNAACQPAEPGLDLASEDSAGEALAVQEVPTAAPLATNSPAADASATPAVSLAAAEIAPEAELRAADAAVLHVKAVNSGKGGWTFHVTVVHPDTGWDDYADGWDVVLPNGTVVKPDADSPFTRLLLHPHENEQPFIRSQSGIVLPEGVTTVTVRAHDLRDGFGGPEIEVDLTADSGPGFNVEP